jgi:YVTN family beta-propeller protein
LNGNSLSLVDLNSNTSILPQPIAVGANPIAVAYNPENNTAWVANFAGNSVSVVDLNLKALRANISAGLAPVSIALNLETKRAVVANQDTNDVSVINLTDNSVVAGSVAVGTHPFAVAIDTKTNIAAVLLNGSRSISLVDLNAETPVKFNTVISNVGENPTGLSVNSNNNTAIVTNPTTDSIYVVPLAFLTQAEHLLSGLERLASANHLVSGSLKIERRHARNQSTLERLRAATPGHEAIRRYAAPARPHR